MELPKKVYIHKSQYWGLMANKDNITKDGIEYTRTDAFIEKALKFLDGCIPDYIELKHANVDTFMDVDNKRFIKDFKNYMKGE